MWMRRKHVSSRVVSLISQLKHQLHKSSSIPNHPGKLYFGAIQRLNKYWSFFRSSLVVSRNDCFVQTRIHFARGT